MKITEVLTENKKKKKVSLNNLVAKHAQTAGAGRHVDKKGKHAPRQIQKRDWKKEAGI